MPRIMPSRRVQNVTELGPHNKMSPEQALAVAGRKQWSEVMILGYELPNNSFVVMSSRMTRESANWLVDHAKLWCLDRL